MSNKVKSGSLLDKNGYYTTAKGKKIKIVGMNPTIVDKYQNAGKLPPVPYRMMETDFGASQKEELTEKDLQNDEEKAIWKKYQEDTSAVLQKRSMNLIKAIIYYGTDVDWSEIDSWKKSQVEAWELEVPNNDVDLKYQYTNELYIATADDLANIMAEVMGKSGVPLEALDDVRDMFRSSVREPQPEDTDSGFEDTERALALE